MKVGLYSILCIVDNLRKAFELCHSTSYSLNGSALFSNISHNIIPVAYISEASEYSCVSIISGAIYKTVPTRLNVVPVVCLDTPKSEILIW